jgi:hypothetical protein
MSHKGHPECIFTTKKGCEANKRLEMGKCVAMTGESSQCDNWGIDRVEDKAYCGQHINSVLLKADNDRRAAKKRAELDGRIDLYLMHRAAHPSLHDTMREP